MTLTRRTRRESITFPVGPDDAEVTVYEPDVQTGTEVLTLFREALRATARAQAKRKADERAAQAKQERAATMDAESTEPVRHRYVDSETATDPTEVDLSDVALDDDEERSVFARLLGPAYDEVLATPGATYGELKSIGTTCIVWLQQDRATAVQFWEASATGEAEAPANREQLRAASKARPASTGTKKRRTPAA